MRLTEALRLEAALTVRPVAALTARLAAALTLSCLAVSATPAAESGTHSSPSADAVAQSPGADGAPPAKPRPDLTGRKRVGVASFYADMFAGRQMADGNIMDPNGANAASRTLPLGTTAKVTNIETGKSAIVTIQDRGPYVDGRIVDLSPGTAEKIGITRRQGLSKVVVAPIAVPLPNGEVKAGAALKEAAPELIDAPQIRPATASSPPPRRNNSPSAWPPTNGARSAHTSISLPAS